MNSRLNEQNEPTHSNQPSENTSSSSLTPYINELNTPYFSPAIQEFNNNALNNSGISAQVDISSPSEVYFTPPSLELDPENPLDSGTGKRKKSKSYYYDKEGKVEVPDIVGIAFIGIRKIPYILKGRTKKRVYSQNAVDLAKKSKNQTYYKEDGKEVPDTVEVIKKGNRSYILESDGSKKRVYSQNALRMKKNRKKQSYYYDKEDGKEVPDIVTANSDQITSTPFTPSIYLDDLNDNLLVDMSTPDFQIPASPRNNEIPSTPNTALRHFFSDLSLNSPNIFSNQQTPSPPSTPFSSGTEPAPDINSIEESLKNLSLVAPASTESAGLVEITDQAPIQNQNIHDLSIQQEEVVHTAAGFNNQASLANLSSQSNQPDLEKNNDPDNNNSRKKTKRGRTPHKPRKRNKSNVHEDTFQNNQQKSSTQPNKTVGLNLIIQDKQIPSPPSTPFSSGTEPAPDMDSIEESLKNLSLEAPASTESAGLVEITDQAPIQNHRKNNRLALNQTNTLPNSNSDIEATSAQKNSEIIINNKKKSYKNHKPKIEIIKKLPLSEILKLDKNTITKKSGFFTNHSFSYATFCAVVRKIKNKLQIENKFQIKNLLSFVKLINSNIYDKNSFGEFLESIEKNENGLGDLLNSYLAKPTNNPLLSELDDVSINEIANLSKDESSSKCFFKRFGFGCDTIDEFLKEINNQLTAKKLFSFISKPEILEEYGNKPFSIFFYSTNFDAALKNKLEKFLYDELKNISDENFQKTINNEEIFDGLVNTNKNQPIEFSNTTTNNLLSVNQVLTPAIVNQSTQTHGSISIGFPIIEEERIEPLPPLRPINQPNNQITETSSTSNFSSPFNFFSSPSFQLPSTPPFSPNTFLELDNLNSQSRNNNQEANNTLPEKT